ncbi:MAG: PASTA domain-containing protein [Ilumatobacteraceae bacterium]|nr:PASTA domain-containing protein [Ilumatobacteraceae bacterium]
MSGSESVLGTVLAGRYRLDHVRVDADSGLTVKGTAQFDALDLLSNETLGVRLTELDRLVDISLGSTTPADALDMFERQCQTATLLQHPVIESMLDHGDVTIGGARYVYTVAQRIAGGSLREFLDRGRRLTPSQALIVGIDVCRALDAAIQQDIVHGDIRPSRLVFGLDRRVRVVGFGAPLRAVDNLGIEQANYAAPELGQGSDRSASSDVYSLALTLVEALTGVIPFAGDSAATALTNRIGKLLPVNADFGALAQVLERAGRPDASERFTPREFGQALVQAAENLPRPTPIEIVGTGLFDDEVASTDPSKPIERPVLNPPVANPPVANPPVFGAPRTEQGAPIIIRTTPLLPMPDIHVPAGASVMQPNPVSPDPVTIGRDSTEPTAIDADFLRSLEAQDPTSQTPTPRKRRWKKRIAFAVLVVMALAGGGTVAYNTVLNPSHLVPDLSGIPEAEARNVLSQYGWTVLVSKERSDVVQKDQIIRTDPAVGASVKKRDSITFFVSEGPTLTALEDFTGLTTDAARVKISELGLVPATTELADEVIAIGTVLSWSIPDQPTLKAGDTLVKGTTVSLVLSSGPAPRTLPKLVGLSVEEATTMLTELGLTVTNLGESPTLAIGRGRISAQLPGVGEKVPRGSAVLIAVSSGQKQVILPAIYGRTLIVVRERLEKEGLIVGKVSGNGAKGLSKALVKGKVVRNYTKMLLGNTVDLVFP